MLDASSELGDRKCSHCYKLCRDALSMIDLIKRWRKFVAIA